MSTLAKDIFTAIMFIMGVFEFLSGEFIISSTLFASATVASNINPRQSSRKNKHWV